MKSAMKEVEKGLISLCNDFISILKEYREKGIISDEEYLKHIAVKEAFLRDVKK